MTSSEELRHDVRGRPVPCRPAPVGFGRPGKTVPSRGDLATLPVAGGFRTAGLRALFLVAAVAGSACSSDDPDPLSRSATLTPELAEGAAVVLLLGAPVASVESDEGQVFFSTRGDTTRVVLVRDEPGPLRFDLRLSDPTSEPTGVVLQVADGQNRLRDDVARYRVEMRP